MVAAITSEFSMHGINKSTEIKVATKPTTSWDKFVFNCVIHLITDNTYMLTEMLILYETCSNT